MNSCQEDIFQETQIPLLLHKVVEVGIVLIEQLGLSCNYFRLWVDRLRQNVLHGRLSLRNDGREIS